MGEPEEVGYKERGAGGVSADGGPVFNGPICMHVRLNNQPFHVTLQHSLGWRRSGRRYVRTDKSKRPIVHADGACLISG